MAAASAQTVRLPDVTEDEWEPIMRINALGALLDTREAARQLIAQARGATIINKASIAGEQGNPLFPSYSASKFAVVTLTRAGGRHGLAVFLATDEARYITGQAIQVDAILVLQRRQGGKRSSR